MNTDTTPTSGNERSEPRLSNPGAQLLGFLGANMTVGSVVAVVAPLLVERRLGASSSIAVVAGLIALAFIGGLILMMLAVRRIRSRGR